MGQRHEEQKQRELKRSAIFGLALHPLNSILVMRGFDGFGLGAVKEKAKAT
jgi:hypothetical protein